jgi:hypothetical protein
MRFESCVIDRGADVPNQENQVDEVLVPVGEELQRDDVFEERHPKEHAATLRAHACLRRVERIRFERGDVHHGAGGHIDDSPLPRVVALCTPPGTGGIKPVSARLEHSA